MTQSTPPITVLIVEDSLTEAQILTRLLERDPQLRVIGVANNGAEAIRMVARLHPTVITMDVTMPVMGGLEATEYIMAHQPTPILAVTGSAGAVEANTGFHMLAAGAVDVLLKPALAEWPGKASQLVDRVKLVARIRVITHVRGKSRPAPAIIVRRKGGTGTLWPVPPPPRRTMTAEEAEIAGRFAGRNRRFAVLAIAASTGGPPALAQLLKRLPRTLTQPILIVQHIPAGFSQGLATWLAAETQRTVRLAQPGDVAQPGIVYLAQDDRHLGLTLGGRLALSSAVAPFGIRPSADILFESVAAAHGANALGVILTGMGHDGAEGLKRMRDGGALTIAQDEASSVIFGMPKSAIELDAVDHVLHLDVIAPFLGGALGTPP